MNAAPEQQARAIAAMLERPEVMVGTACDRWLPVAIEAADDAGSRSTHDWLAALPEVEFVDVVHISFETDAPAPEAGAQPISMV